ncbi:MAG: glutamate--tRNA ligase family protein [Oscillospiraceae bacterium]
MGIAHVVSGGDSLSSAPKTICCMRASAGRCTTMSTVSPVMRSTHNKMSKRHGDPSYEDLMAQGFLTDAVIELRHPPGWSPGGHQAEQEIFSLKELIDCFEIGGISKSPAIFDKEELKYFNSEYIRAMSPEAFAKIAEPYIRR